MAIARFAIKSWIGRNENALNHGAVVQTPEELLGCIGRALLENQVQRPDRILLSQPFSESPGQVGHSIPGADAPFVQPRQQLLHPICRLLPRGELRLQLGQTLRSDIDLHGAQHKA